MTRAPSPAPLSDRGTDLYARRHVEHCRLAARPQHVDEELPLAASRVREELQSNYDSLRETASADYLVRMIVGLGHWVDAADARWLRPGHPALPQARLTRRLKPNVPGPLEKRWPRGISSALAASLTEIRA
jgi:hypothetical protein